MRGRNVGALVFAVLAGSFARPARGQDGQDERLYRSLFAPQDADFAGAVREWVGARRKANKELTRGLEWASQTLESKELTIPAVLRKHGVPETTTLLHEYSEDGLRRVLSVQDTEFRSGVLDELRLVETLEAQVRASVESEKPDKEKLLQSAGTYAAVLLDLDAKMVVALRQRDDVPVPASAEKRIPLGCVVTARTVDPAVLGSEAKEQPNYTVWYVLEFWESDQKKWRTFDRLSSPTTQKLPAGYYVMWCRPNKGTELREGERKRVIVTEPTEIDLLVPQP